MGKKRAKELSYAERATKYAQDVAKGRVRAGLGVRLACARHLADLERQKDASWPYAWEPEKGNRICRFAENMVHIKGKWAGQLIRLEDWQCFVLAVPFGWARKSDGLRRFREVYGEIPRKNGKSMLGAIVGLYLSFADSEPGAEVYSGATTLEQALEVFRPAWMMVDKNPEFRGHFGLELGGTSKNPGPIYCMKDGSRFAPVVGQPGDGASPHGAIVDEYHEHPTPDLYDTMKTGMGARLQPMMVVITTAGVDTSAPCFEHRGRVLDVLKGTVTNEELFGIIFGVDEKDDWKDFDVWRKANPNLGVSVFEDYLRGQHRDALQSASKQNILLTKHLNKWMNAGRAWMNMTKWEACARPGMRLEDFRGRRAWVSLDLASKVDIAAAVAVIEDGDGWAMLCKAYLPEATVELPHNAHYRAWQAQGFLTVTDGARTDFQRIEDDLREWSEVLAVQELPFDPREASYLIQQIQTWASFECVEVPQAPAHMSEPMKELEGLVAAGKLAHPDDPVFNWMMGNVVLKQARGGGPVKYFYPAKEREAAKIDGPVALIMALKRALAGGGYEPSIYENEELWAAGGAR